MTRPEIAVVCGLFIGCANLVRQAGIFFMGTLADYPMLTFAATLLVLTAAVYLGAWLTHGLTVHEEQRGHLSQITGASLSILALLIGFSFSAAISRYDLRKSCEQEEANAVASEYDLAGLLPDADASQLRVDLRRYIDLRVAFYEAKSQADVPPIRAQREKLEGEMWAIVYRNVEASKSPIMAQVVSGLNAVTSRPGYSQAAALDRIPTAAWTLIAMLAVLCCVLLGYGTQTGKPVALRLVVPAFVALCFFFIATLDSQRRGMIRVLPENLIRVQHSIENQGAGSQEGG